MQPPLNIRYSSTNHFLVSCRGGKLLIDAGWAGSLPQLRHGLRRYGVESSDVKYVMLTHHHPDHAGLTQEVKGAFGARLLIHERQVPFLEALRLLHERRAGIEPFAYVPIVVGLNDIVVTSRDSRDALAAIGIAGEIVETPGHSEDSVSLVLDGGIAFVGDLPLPGNVVVESSEEVRASWKRLLALGVRTAYPSHPGPIEAEDVERLLSGSLPE